MFSKLLGWIVLHTRSDTTKDIEILVLRHQLAVLQRPTPRPRMSSTDRALIAGLTRLLPVRIDSRKVTLDSNSRGIGSRLDRHELIRLYIVARTIGNYRRRY